MKKLLHDLFTSKKFNVAMLGALTTLLMKLGVPETNAAELAVMLVPFVSYVLAQGNGGDRKDAQREAIEAARVDAGIIRENQLADEERREAQYKS